MWSQGWSEQPHGGECRSDGVISPKNQTHNEDWSAAKLNTAWLRDKTSTGATHAQPFYVYQGMNIVHPPYITTQHWYELAPCSSLLAPCSLLLALLRDARLAGIIRTILLLRYDTIADNLTVPEWQPLSEMHPCAIQSSMLKGCSVCFYAVFRLKNDDFRLKNVDF